MHGNLAALGMFDGIGDTFLHNPAGMQALGIGNIVIGRVALFVGDEVERDPQPFQAGALAFEQSADHLCRIGGLAERDAVDDHAHVIHADLEHVEHGGLTEILLFGQQHARNELRADPVVDFHQEPFALGLDQPDIVDGMLFLQHLAQPLLAVLQRFGDAGGFGHLVVLRGAVAFEHDNAHHRQQGRHAELHQKDFFEPDMGQKIAEQCEGIFHLSRRHQIIVECQHHGQRRLEDQHASFFFQENIFQQDATQQDRHEIDDACGHPVNIEIIDAFAAEIEADQRCRSPEQIAQFRAHRIGFDLGNDFGEIGKGKNRPCDEAVHQGLPQHVIFGGHRHHHQHVEKYRPAEHGHARQPDQPLALEQDAEADQKGPQSAEQHRRAAGGGFGDKLHLPHHVFDDRFAADMQFAEMEHRLVIEIFECHHIGVTHQMRGNSHRIGS